MNRLVLPFPPSVNAMYANGGNKRGRHKTAKYKAWEQEASEAINDSHRQGMLDYSLCIALKAPDKRARDLGNLEKAVSDLLVSHGVVKDDRYCRRLTMFWDETATDECVVLVMPAEKGLAI